jgi:hypothetical protein
MRDLGDKAPVVFWTETEATCFLMFGSPLHLVGRKTVASGIGIWSPSDAVHYLLAEVNDSFNLPGEEEFQNAVCRRIWASSYQERLSLIFARIVSAVSPLPTKVHFVAKRLAAFDRATESGKSIVVANLARFTLLSPTSGHLPASRGTKAALGVSIQRIQCLQGCVD